MMIWGEREMQQGAGKGALCAEVIRLRVSYPQNDDTPSQTLAQVPEFTSPLGLMMIWRKRERKQWEDEGRRSWRLRVVVGCKILKRKLVDFAWNRRFFYLPGACLPFLGVNPAKSFNQPNFLNPGRLFLSIVGSSSGKPGETGTGGRKKNQKIGEFSFRGILQPTTAPNSVARWPRALRKDRWRCEQALVSLQIKKSSTRRYVDQWPF